MQFPLALLTTFSLSLRAVDESFPLPGVTESDRSLTPNYEGLRKSKRGGETPGVPVPLSERDKMEIVNEHNRYREHVFPPAANMRYMRYREDIAHGAQLWANSCRFKHGRPVMQKFEAVVGQNLYKGHHSSPSYYIKLWYDEVHDFDMRLKQCNASMCGHYLQEVWATSHFIGCGEARCRTKRGNYNLFVCHYYTAFESLEPYKVGVPCSLCDDASGRFCYRNMCVSKWDCHSEQWPCECNLKCHNCGVLDKSTCTCKCPPGWDFQDCSEKCTNISDYCGRSNGFRNSLIGCEMDKGSAKYHNCRKMCGTCASITEKNKEETCCGGELCASGYVLDYKGNCSCRLLCPGPECYRFETAENACRGITSTLTVLILTIHILRKFQEM